MSDDIRHLNLDHQDFAEAPPALLDHVRKLKKQFDAINAEVAELRGLATTQALSDALGDFRSPAKVERQLLADGVDPLDRSAVDGWLKEYGEDYARKPEAEASQL